MRPCRSRSRTPATGLPAGNQIFDGFWKADSARARSDGGGAGLGLAIARGLVEAHGGKIWAESRTGGGARVVFELPMTSGSSLNHSRVAGGLEGRREPSPPTYRSRVG